MALGEKKVSGNISSPNAKVTHKGCGVATYFTEKSAVVKTFYNHSCLQYNREKCLPLTTKVSLVHCLPIFTQW